MKHIGFKGAVRSVEAKEGYSAKTAAKIIGYGKAHASAAAKKKNPRLNKMGGAHARRAAGRPID